MQDANTENWDGTAVPRNRTESVHSCHKKESSPSNLKLPTFEIRKKYFKSVIIHDRN